MLERLRSSEEKAPLDSAFGLPMTDKLRHWKPSFPTRFLAAIAGIENREKCSRFISRKRKPLLCVGALSAFGYRLAAAGSLDWRASATGIFRIVSPRKVSRKQTSHICVIGESANNRTTPGTCADRRRSIDRRRFLGGGLEALRTRIPLPPRPSDAHARPFRAINSRRTNPPRRLGDRVVRDGEAIAI